MTNSTYVVRPATLNDIPVILDNLIENSLDDFTNYKVNPVLSLAEDISNSEAHYIATANGKPMAIVGFETDCFWMHMCKGVEEHPVSFIKWARRWLDEQKKPYLWNHINIQYTQALKMSKAFGFKALRVYPHLLTDKYTVESVRLWQSEQS